MKLLNKTIPAAALAMTLIAAGPAAAYNLSDINSTVVSTHNVSFEVEDGVATLTGSVHKQFESAALELAAKGLDGVEEVENYLLID